MGMVQLKPEEEVIYGLSSFKIPVNKKRIKIVAKPLVGLTLKEIRDFYIKFKFASRGTHICIKSYHIGGNYLYISQRTFIELNLMNK
jgi:hypothetical protein